MEVTKTISKRTMSQSLEKDVENVCSKLEVDICIAKGGGQSQRSGLCLNCKSLETRTDQTWFMCPRCISNDLVFQDMAAAWKAFEEKQFEHIEGRCLHCEEIKIGFLDPWYVFVCLECWKEECSEFCVQDPKAAAMDIDKLKISWSFLQHFFEVTFVLFL